MTPVQAPETAAGPETGSSAAFRAALVTALFSVGAVVLAVRLGWLGADVGRAEEFCEADSGGWVKQPMNTWANLGFVVAGIAVGWRARVPGAVGARLRSFPGLVATYAVVVVLLGPGSAAMHATGSTAGGVLDLLSMYLIAGFAAAYAVTRWWGRDVRFFWALFASLLVGCELVEQLGGEVPVVHHAGNAVFAALLVVAIVLEVRIWRRDPRAIDIRLGAASVGTLLVAFVIWNLEQHVWCDPESWLQGHAVWHLLCAVAAYLMFRYYASETDRHLTLPQKMR